jgi:hypothetical protein
MTDEEIRLKCLELVGVNNSLDIVLKEAKQLYNFVVGKSEGLSN